MIHHGKYLNKYVIHDRRYDRIDYCTDKYTYRIDKFKSRVIYSPIDSKKYTSFELPYIQNEYFEACLQYVRLEYWNSAVTFRDMALYNQTHSDLYYIMHMFYFNYWFKTYQLDIRFPINGFWSFTKNKGSTLLYYRGTDPHNLVEC